MKSIEQIAIDAALLNPIQKLPRMAAVLITSSGGLFIGINKYKTHPFQAEWGKNAKSIFLHAELDAIIKALKWSTCNLVGGKIFIARVLKNGTPALARPCSGCFGALLHFGINDIKWTENKYDLFPRDPKSYYELLIKKRRY